MRVDPVTMHARGRFWIASGMPGSFCTRVNETNWYERSHLWREERSIVQSRS